MRVRARLGPSWARLGPSWARIGPSWARLGPSWACAPRTSPIIPTSPSRSLEGWYSAFCSDGSVVVRAMLSPHGPHRPVTFHASEETCRQWDLTLQHCRSRAAEAVVLTDSQCVALILLNFLNEWVRPEIIKASRRYRTFTRDGWRCQVPGCRSRAQLNAHHVVFMRTGSLCGLSTRPAMRCLDTTGTSAL